MYKEKDFSNIELDYMDGLDGTFDNPDLPKEFNDKMDKIDERNKLKNLNK